MLILKPQRRPKVPDRIAILAALTLALTALAGMPDRDGDNLALAAQTVDSSDSAQVVDDSTARKGKLNISKLLFGHG